jgi:hypothetical protein
LHDWGSIVPTIYLCVSHIEALLMASNTSYHKHLHGSRRFAYHILALFVACRCLVVLAPEFYALDRKELPVAQLDFGPWPVILEQPREKNYKHLKALYIKGHINGHPVNKMLVDTGATVNIMPCSILHQLGHSAEDLIKTNIMLCDFNGQASEAQGILNVDLTVGSKTVLTFFFIVSSKSTYTVLLGRDWIHANCCIPSMMHQSNLVGW